MGLHTAQYVGFFFAQFTNVVLLLLISKKAKKLFGSYRHVMTIFTAYSLIYTWIEIIALPLMHIHRSMFIIMVDSFLSHELLIGYYVICLYCASYALCISLLATQFYYRYIVVCKPEHLGKLNGRKLWLIFLPGVFFFFAWYSLVFFPMGRTKEKEEFARKEIMEAYEEDTAKIAFIALQFWDTDPNGDKHFRFFDALGYAGCASIIVICFSTIAICATKIFFKLKCSQNVMSEKTKELNRQLLITLVLQTALPFFMMYITVGIILSLPFFEIEVGRKGNIVGSLAGIYPAIEPLIAIFFVKDFRKTILCKVKIHSEINQVQLQHVDTTRCNSQKSSNVFINKSLI